MHVKVAHRENALDMDYPSYQTPGSAGMDLLAALPNGVVTTIAPGKLALIPTGLVVAIPAGFEIQIRPRSGLAVKHRVGILNSPGTIDADYRGEVKIILTNFGKEDFIIRRGDRIAQMVIAPHARAAWEERAILDETARGAGGFGHTGR